MTGARAVYWSRAAAASPAFSVAETRLLRAIRVAGCSGPSTRSMTGTQLGEQVAGGGGVPRLPRRLGQVVAGGQGIGVLGAEHPLHDGRQGRVLVAGGGGVPRLQRRLGQVVAGGQGVGVLGAADPLHDEDQGRALVAGGGGVPRLQRRLGQVVAGCQGIGCSWPSTRSMTGTSAVHWSRAAAASPASSVAWASMLRAARVSGCSGP